MIEAKKVMLNSGLSRGKDKFPRSQNPENEFSQLHAREQLKTVRVWSMFRVPLYFGIFIPTLFFVAKQCPEQVCILKKFVILWVFCCCISL